MHTPKPWRVLHLAEGWRGTLGHEICAFPNGDILIAHPERRNFLRYDATGSPIEVDLPVAHSQLMILDDNLIACLEEERRHIATYDVNLGKVIKRIELPCRADRVLRLNSNWLLSELSGRFHLVGEAGVPLGSLDMFETPETALETTRAPQVDALLRKAYLERLDASSFVAAHAYQPIVEAYGIDGRHLWKNVIDSIKVPSEEEVEALSAAVQGAVPDAAAVLVQVTAGLIVGDKVVVLHLPTGVLDSRPAVSIMRLDGSLLHTVALAVACESLLSCGEGVIATRTVEGRWIELLRLDDIAQQSV